MALAPPPLRTQVIDQNGVMARPWQQWFDALWRRTGGAIDLDHTSPFLTPVDTTTTLTPPQQTVVQTIQALDLGGGAHQGGHAQAVEVATILTAQGGVFAGDAVPHWVGTMQSLMDEVRLLAYLALPEPLPVGLSAIEGTFTMTGTGFVANPTVTASYLQIGKQVLLHFPLLTGTSNATTFTLTGLPVALQPTKLSQNVVRIRDNSAADTSGLLRLNAGSLTMDVFATVAAGAWTAAGVKRIYDSWIPYALL